MDGSACVWVWVGGGVGAGGCSNVGSWVICLVIPWPGGSGGGKAGSRLGCGESKGQGGTARKVGGCSSSKRSTKDPMEKKAREVEKTKHED